MPALRPPVAPLTDGVIGLRPFLPRDLPAFHAATRPGGNLGTWLIVDNNDPRRSLDNYINSWSVDQEMGQALAIVNAGDDGLVGSLLLLQRGGDSVELSYGIAPGRRGSGLATRAATLAADWLLNEAGWTRVELRIDDNNLASQRIARKAGFRAAGRVRTWVPSAGREFDDLLYLRCR